MMISRRKFVKATFFLATTLNACKKSTLNSAPLYNDNEDIFNSDLGSKIILESSYKILFIGDSITDSKRDRTILLPNDGKGLGNGYVRNISNNLLSQDRFKNILIYNRGNSGNGSLDLLNRWDSDCIQLAPNVVSILVGVNDVRNKVSPNDFYTRYKEILKITKNRLPNSEIIICEPFILPNIASYDVLKKNFNEYRKAIRTLVIEYKTNFIPYYQQFVKANEILTSAELLSDGFHPTQNGINLLAQSWLSALST